MRVLVACEESGRVRDAFLARGHDAISCDILPTSSPGPHIQDDVLRHLAGWDLIIAHPPCTYLANSGVCWLHRDPARWKMLDEAAEFFLKLYDAPCDRVCVENPIMHKYARERIRGMRPTQIVQPWMFGHMEQKATGLFLRGLPPLEETNNVREAMMKLPDNERQRLHYLPPSKDRARLRSQTFAGIAAAMADQWRG